MVERERISTSTSMAGGQMNKWYKYIAGVITITLVILAKVFGFIELPARVEALAENVEVKTTELGNKTITNKDHLKELTAQISQYIAVNEERNKQQDINDQRMIEQTTRHQDMMFKLIDKAE